VINELIDRMDLTAVSKSFRGGGTRCYLPKMMLKVIMYASAAHVFSGRHIAKTVREIIPFMWRSGGAGPIFPPSTGFVARN